MLGFNWTQIGVIAVVGAIAGRIVNMYMDTQIPADLAPLVRSALESENKKLPLDKQFDLKKFDAVK